MKFLTFVHIALLALILILLHSCKDKGDEQAPRIFIESPFENEFFQSVDTVEVVAQITDNEKVVSVTVEILDSDFNTLSISEKVPVSGSDVQFAYPFEISAPELESGSYFLAVRANDGHNIGSAFVSLQIGAVPRVLQRFFAVTNNANNTHLRVKGADEENYQIALTRFGDFGGAALNYREDIFSLAGSQIGDAVFYETEEFTPIASVEGFGSSGTPYFTGMDYSPEAERFFLLFRNSYLQVFDRYAQSLNAFDLLTNHYPVRVFAPDADRYFVVQKEIDGPEYALTTYSQAGLLMANLSIPGPCLSVTRKEANEVYVWIDAPEGLELNILNTLTGLFSSPYSRPGASLAGVAPMGLGTFAISTSDGLLRYEYFGGGTIVLNSTAPMGKLRYEDISGSFYLTHQNSIKRYSPTGDLLESIDLNAEVVYFGLDYTR